MPTNVLVLRVTDTPEFRADQIVALHVAQSEATDDGRVTYTTDTPLQMKRLRDVEAVLLIGPESSAGSTRPGVIWDLEDSGRNYPSPLPLPSTPEPFVNEARGAWVVLSNPRDLEVKRGQWETSTKKDLMDSLAAGQQTRFYVVPHQNSEEN